MATFGNSLREWMAQGLKYDDAELVCFEEPVVYENVIILVEYIDSLESIRPFQRNLSFDKHAAYLVRVCGVHSVHRMRNVCIHEPRKDRAPFFSVNLPRRIGRLYIFANHLHVLVEHISFDRRSVRLRKHKGYQYGSFVMYGRDFYL